MTEFEQALQHEAEARKIIEAAIEANEEVGIANYMQTYQSDWYDVDFDEDRYDDDEDYRESIDEAVDELAQADAEGYVYVARMYALSSTSEARDAAYHIGKDTTNQLRYLQLELDSLDQTGDIDEGWYIDTIESVLDLHF